MTLMSRRSVLKLGLSSVSASLFFPQSFTENLLNLKTEKSLSFYNIHTAESLDIVYSSFGLYHDEALASINHLMRDHRTDEIYEIDIKLLDVLFELKQGLATSDPLYVISGYRSPKTNLMLSKTGTGVAKKSLHTKGRAVDIRLPGTDLTVLRDAAQGLRAGGVGYYPGSDFVHMDTGNRIAHWQK